MLDPVRLPVYTVVLPLYLQPGVPPVSRREEGVEGLEGALITRKLPMMSLPRCSTQQTSRIYISQTSVSNSQCTIKKSHSMFAVNHKDVITNNALVKS